MQKKYSDRPNSRFLEVSLFCMVCLSASHLVSAQPYTYFGGGISLFSSSMFTGPVSPLTKASFGIDGGAYDVTLRQEINGFLSLETGISAHNLEYDYLFNNDIYVHIGAFPVHKIPLKAELEVDVLRDRIAAFASFGYQFCIPFDNSSRRYTSYSAVGENMESVGVEWNYNPDRWFYSLYQVGTGLRFRLVDALLFELELGYGFSLKNMINATLTYLGQTGEEIIYIHKDGLNYWYMQFGFSYPIQRIVQGIKTIME